MFNSAAFSSNSSAPSTRGVSAFGHSRWVTAEPVSYGLGGLAPPSAEVAPSFANYQAIRSRQELNESPLPLNPGTGPAPPRRDTLHGTPDTSRHGTGRARRVAEEVSGVVATPPASTIRRPPMHSNPVSPTDGDARIADRLADLWSEYVGATAPAPTHHHDPIPSYQPTDSRSGSLTTIRVTAAAQDDEDAYIAAYTSRATPAAKRWMHRSHVQTPLSSSDVGPAQQRHHGFDVRPQSPRSSARFADAPMYSHHTRLDRHSQAYMPGSLTSTSLEAPPTAATRSYFQSSFAPQAVARGHGTSPLPPPSLPTTTYGLHEHPPNSQWTQRSPRRELWEQPRPSAPWSSLPHNYGSSAVVPFSKHVSPMPAMTSGLQEALRTLEERERGQREHVRFVETQARKNVSAKESLERPFGAPSRSAFHGGTATEYWPTTGSSFQLSSAADRSAAEKERLLVAEYVGGKALTARLSPPRSMSPRRVPFLQDRIRQLIDDESRGRYDFVVAERQVRDAVCSVIAGLQRHADFAAAQHAVHRGLLIVIADEQQDRKKVESLQEHIFSAVSNLFRDATSSLIATAYERISVYTRFYTKMHSDETRQRLELLDAEVLERRSVMVELHEAELALYQAAALRQSAAHRLVQRAMGHEAEIRFGIVQEEDHIRNDRFSRWAHERSVLEHLERQRLSSSRTIYTKLRNVQEQESALRIDIEETAERMHSTLGAFYESVHERHRQTQRASFERAWRDAHRSECAAQIRELEEREQTLRAEGVMAWGCVVEALGEWQAEMSLQQELESQYQRRKASAAQLLQLEDVEKSARTAIVFAEAAVHTQHLEWSREILQNIKEARAVAFARLVHNLSSSEAFTRSQIAEEHQRGLSTIGHNEYSVFTALLVHACVDEEDEARETVQWFERQGLNTIARQAASEHDDLRDREFRAACRQREYDAMVEAYTTAEWDSRCGLLQMESQQRESMGAQFSRDAAWITENIEARRAAAEATRAELLDKEEAHRDEVLAVEAHEWFDLGRSEEQSCRRAVEATNAAQRQRAYQLRASAMTLSRLEEVNREVIVGAAAKSYQTLEERQSQLWKRFEEEHARMLLVMEERKRRTFDERRRHLLDHEATTRGELVDVSTEVWDGLMSQFELRRPAAQSDNPGVVAFMKVEHKGRLDLEDMFTYERWNLADLEAMSRDDVADGVAPLSLPRYTPPSSRQPSTSAAREEATNDFAKFVEESFPREPPVGPPQPPHPTEWEFNESTSFHTQPADASRSPASVVHSARKVPATRPIPDSHAQEALQHMHSMRRASSTVTSTTNGTPSSTPRSADAVGGPGSIPVPDAIRAMLRTASNAKPMAIPTSRPIAPSTRGVAVDSSPSLARMTLEELTTDVLGQEAAGRRRLAQSQYQELAIIIQQNIETLPDA